MAWSALGFGAISLVVWNASLVTTAPLLYAVLFVIVGAPGVGLVTGLISSLQLEAGDQQRGRVFGRLGLADNAGQAVGIVTAGLLAAPLGLMAVLELQGTLYLVAGIVAAAGLGARGGSVTSSGHSGSHRSRSARSRSRPGLASDRAT